MSDSGSGEEGRNGKDKKVLNLQTSFGPGGASLGSGRKHSPLNPHIAAASVAVGAMSPLGSSVDNGNDSTEILSPRDRKAPLETASIPPAPLMMPSMMSLESGGFAPNTGSSSCFMHGGSGGKSPGHGSRSHSANIPLGLLRLSRAYDDEWSHETPSPTSSTTADGGKQGQTDFLSDRQDSQFVQTIQQVNPLRRRLSRASIYSEPESESAIPSHHHLGHPRWTSLGPVQMTGSPNVSGSGSPLHLPQSPLFMTPNFPPRRFMQPQSPREPGFGGQAEGSDGGYSTPFFSLDSQYGHSPQSITMKPSLSHSSSRLNYQNRAAFLQHQQQQQQQCFASSLPHSPSTLHSAHTQRNSKKFYKSFQDHLDSSDQESLAPRSGLRGRKPHRRQIMNRFSAFPSKISLFHLSTSLPRMPKWQRRATLPPHSSVLTQQLQQQQHKISPLKTNLPKRTPKSHRRRNVLHEEEGDDSGSNTGYRSEGDLVKKRPPPSVISTKETSWMIEKPNFALSDTGMLILHWIWIPHTYVWVFYFRCQWKS